MPPPITPSHNRSTLLGLIALIVLAVCVFLFRDRIHFDWPTFRAHLRTASPIHIAAGIALIFATNLLRSIRWAIFLAPVKKVPPLSLTGSQFIGFSAVALFGRLADLTRPYLIAKRTDLSLASQIAVYTVERIFDLAAAAILFSTALALTPHNAPHHRVFVRAGIVSLAGTAFLALFALAIRLYGEPLATAANRLVGRISKPFAAKLAAKLLSFRAGLNTIASTRDFLLALAASILLWAMVGEAYVQTLHAFIHTPALAGLTYSRTLLLMAASMGSSLIQLPIVGWFTQIALTAAAMHTFYGAPIEDATACAAVLLFITTLAIVPVGLIFTRVERTTLRAAAHASKSRETIPTETHL